MKNIKDKFSHNNKKNEKKGKATPRSIECSYMQTNNKNKMNMNIITSTRNIIKNINNYKNI